MSRTISFFVVVLLALIVVRSEYVETHAVVNTTVTFDKEISRILRKRCLACHSDRNIGIPMTSYEETRPWAGSIQLEVLAKHMPPWRAVAGYGDFVNDSALTTKELQFITAWIEGNGPKTKLERVVINVEQNETPESERLKIDFATWVHGKPDLAAVLPTAMVEPGSGDTTRPVEKIGRAHV